MKKIKGTIPVAALALAMLGASCKKSFFSEVNVNHNAPDSSAIVPGVLLSTVEGALGYTQGGEVSRITSLLTQQTLGAARQSQGHYGYTLTSQDFDAGWGNLFTAVMGNNVRLLRLSDARGDNAYGAISRILMAYTLQMSVDNWGAVPYSEAFNGLSTLQPKYNDDKALYDTIASLLNTAIIKLATPKAGLEFPGGEDVVYQGSATKWAKFAHAIKARLYIHQSKGNAAMATSALAEIAQALSSNDDNAQYVFGNTETSANPWYQFNEQRADIAFDVSTLATRMEASNDPRFTAFIDTTYSDVNGVGMGAYYGNISSPVEFIAYDELLFMAAEATLRTSGNINVAQGFYQAAIRNNMNKLGVSPADADTYITANGVLPGTVPAAIAQVSAEEYIALYLNPEAWTLFRRNNSPALTPVIGTAIPRRFLYPQTEYSYNGSNTPAATLFTPKIFWDK